MTLPFISTVDKAEEAVRRINATAEAEGVRPVIFSTLVQEDMREIIKRANGLFLDFFDAFLGPLELELKVKSSRAQGKAHGMLDIGAYTLRINATNFALANDDGAVTRDYDRADLDAGRRVALRQDADVPVHGLAIRHFCREFPVRRRGVRDRRVAGVAGEGTSASCTD